MGKLENSLKLLRLLMTHDLMNSTELCKHLSVTDRQLRNYLDTLKSAGFSIGSKSGPCGGYFMSSRTCPLCYHVSQTPYQNSLKGRCSIGGHEIYRDELDGLYKYKDNDELFDKNNERPCAKCGHAPTQTGDDHCISNLGYVVNACCGHGSQKGYIQFNDGTIVKGFFEIERK